MARSGSPLCRRRSRPIRRTQPGDPSRHARAREFPYPERRPRRPRAGAPSRLLRHQPRPRLGGGARALREPAQRLLAPAARGAASRPRLYEPSEQFELLREGIGVTNAAYRTTPGSGDLRRGDFAGSAERLERIARELEPGWLGFVGKEAYRGAFGERPELGVQERTLGDDAALRAPVDVARERGGAVARAAALVPRARRPRVGAAEAASACARSSRRRRPDAPLPLRQRVRDVVDPAGRRHRAGRDGRADAAPRAARGVRPRRTSSSARSSGSSERWVRSTSPATAGTSHRCVPRARAGVRERAAARPERGGLARGALVHARRARAGLPTRPRGSRASGVRNASGS